MQAECEDEVPIKLDLQRCEPALNAPPDAKVLRSILISLEQRKEVTFGNSMRIKRLESVETSTDLKEKISELSFAEDNQHLDMAAKYTERYVSSWTAQSSTTNLKSVGENINAWCGWLKKLNRFAAWQPRWVQLRWDRGSVGSKRMRAALIYQSDTKGEQILYVDDVRRESWLDSGASIAFSVRLISPMELKGEDQGTDSGWRMRIRKTRRLQLMAASSLEAATFLICLRRILQPDRPHPTLSDAARQPGRVLQAL
jgi:hypothetical protein